MDRAVTHTPRVGELWLVRVNDAGQEAVGEIAWVSHDGRVVTLDPVRKRGSIRSSMHRGVTRLVRRVS